MRFQARFYKGTLPRDLWIALGHCLSDSIISTLLRCKITETSFSTVITKSEKGSHFE
jgi:hypothetical protein